MYLKQIVSLNCLIKQQIGYFLLRTLLGKHVHLAPVVQKLDSAIHRIKHYPVDYAIGFPNTYPLGSDLSGG